MGDYIGIDLHKTKSFVTRMTAQGHIREQVNLLHTTGPCNTGKKNGQRSPFLVCNVVEVHFYSVCILLFSSCTTSIFLDIFHFASKSRHVRVADWSL